MRIFSKKTVVVADKLQDIGGGETVLAQICYALKPDFVVTSTVNNKHDWEKFLGVSKIVTPFWGRFVQNRLVWFALYPVICILMGRVKLYSDGPVLVYSSTVSKYIKVQSKKKIVLYSNYPARGIFFPEEFFKSALMLFFIRPFLVSFRLLEKTCMRRYENIYVISEACKEAYANKMNIDSKVLNCPTEQKFYDFYENNISHTNPMERLAKYDGKLVLVSRLVDWKNLEYVFEYFESQSILKLNVIGGGPLLNEYRKKYSKNCNFLGYLSVEEKMQVMSKSIGLVFPSVQEWSLVTIEANALGLPVLGVRCAATEETQIVLTEKTGKATCVVYDLPTSEHLSGAISDFLKLHWEPEFIYKHAENFSPNVFHQKLITIVNR